MISASAGQKTLLDQITLHDKVLNTVLHNFCRIKIVSKSRSKSEKAVLVI